ncbi:MAG TPA: DegT/DnrJ/EryC1/StrS family aminotransferase [Bryobacteraceae bacterium]|nr:DegT/DnrJ/EryC1/StrS family aminotransferase [Bryobacteraceae bacterium]
MNIVAKDIPFLDLLTPHDELREELCGVFNAALSTAGFIGGPVVAQFEEEFAQYCDAKHCVGVANGTDALRFALIAAGVKQGDLVITVPNTFIATVEAISQAGAQPDFVDVDERTYNMDPAKLEEYLEEDCYFEPITRQTTHRRTRRPVTAIVPVHLYGQTADMDAILSIAERYNLIVIEDACQAHGAEYFSRRDNRWKKAGSMGRAAAFSFYPGKNLGACGEAGAVTTNDVNVAQRIAMLRDHGQIQKYHHDIEGYNGRLDAIQAGILRIKLKRLNAWNQERRASARIYKKLFTATGNAVGIPYEPTWSKAVYHLYVVRVQDRNNLQAYLAAERIGTGIHYPIPLHLQNAYRGLYYRPGDFPVTESAAREILSLPMYPGLAHSQQSRVVQQIVEFVCAEETYPLPARALA